MLILYFLDMMSSGDSEVQMRGADILNHNPECSRKKWGGNPGVPDVYLHVKWGWSFFFDRLLNRPIPIQLIISSVPESQMLTPNMSRFLARSLRFTFFSIRNPPLPI